MKQEEITKIVNKVYPLICADNNSTALVDFHYNIYERLSGEKGMTGEVQAHAEYDWSTDKIYIYTTFLQHFLLEFHKDECHKFHRVDNKHQILL